MDRAEALAIARKKGPGFALEIGVNFVLPYLIYTYLSPSQGEVRALIASSLPPIAISLIEFARRRRVDALSILVLAGIALSLLAFIGGGGVRWLQLREKLVTGVIGLIFLVSAAIGRPLIYQLARAGMARKGQTEESARFEALRENRMFKRSMTVMTVVWGLGLILDVMIGAVLVFTLTIPRYLIVSPILGYAVMGGLTLWTFWYARRAQRRGDAARAAAKGERA